jgi:hypothetical protein
MISIREEGKELRDRLNEVRNEIVQDEPFVNRGVSEFLAKTDPIRRDVLQLLDKFGLSDTAMYRDYKQRAVWPWSGPAGGIERPLIIRHFHKWIDFSMNALEFGLDRGTRPRVRPGAFSHKTARRLRRTYRKSNPKKRSLREVKTILVKELLEILNSFGEHSYKDYPSFSRDHEGLLVVSIVDAHLDAVVALGKRKITLPEALTDLPKHRMHLSSLARAILATREGITPNAVDKRLRKKKGRTS